MMRRTVQYAVAAVHGGTKRSKYAIDCAVMTAKPEQVKRRRRAAEREIRHPVVDEALVKVEKVQRRDRTL